MINFHVCCRSTYMCNGFSTVKRGHMPGVFIFVSESMRCGVMCEGIHLIFLSPIYIYVTNCKAAA